jgi:uncharacterized protein (TIGR00369 family)
MGLVHSEIQQEAPRGFHMDPRDFASLSGYQLLRGFPEGRLLSPPVGYLYGLRVTEVEQGSVTFTMPASPWLLSPQGILSGASLALLVDGPLACTIQTALPPATPYTTSELSMQYLRPVKADGRLLTCRGRLVHAGQRLAMSEAEVVDADGNVIALASTRCVIMPALEVTPGRVGEPGPAVEPSWPTPHPYERQVEGEVLPQETWDRLSGLEVMRGHISGELPPPPICKLTGIWPITAEDGAMTWTMPATEWMSSPVAGQLYGGLTAFLAGMAIDGAFETVMPAGTAFASLDLKVYLLRPVPPDMRDLTATAQVVQRGRRLCIGTCEVVNADGKSVALGTASAMVLPGRPATVARAIDEASAG